MAASYQISKAAEKDWRSIAQYTLDNFGEQQVQKYTSGLLKCLSELANRSGQYKNINVADHQVLVKHCPKHYIFALDKADTPLLVIAVFMNAWI